MASRPVATMALAVAGAKGVMTWLRVRVALGSSTRANGPRSTYRPPIARHPSHPIPRCVASPCGDFVEQATEPAGGGAIGIAFHPSSTLLRRAMTSVAYGGYGPSTLTVIPPVSMPIG